MSDYGTHPVADLFPMLGADELDELAADIKERGLLHPVVLDGLGRILDGRNRLAACHRAEVEPEFVTYDGDDPGGYALAVNIARRHLTKGQQAAVVAKSNLPFHSETEGPSKGMVSRARTVKEHTPGQLESVISGALGLREAYDKALTVKNAADSAEARLARLREEYPELADKVVEGELTLAGAQAEQKAREAQRESERRAAVANLRSVLTYLVSTSIPAAELAAQYADVLDEFKADDLDYAAAAMAEIATLKEGT